MERLTDDDLIDMIDWDKPGSSGMFESLLISLSAKIHEGEPLSRKSKTFILNILEELYQNKKIDFTKQRGPIKDRNFERDLNMTREIHELIESGYPRIHAIDEVKKNREQKNYNLPPEQKVIYPSQARMEVIYDRFKDFL
ncbi:MAG: hypothetical protein KDI13_09430 [Alphaproteobacteria bacterium]|nr:hypothetical protein [Alphaproteobacteria bacterium]